MITIVSENPPADIPATQLEDGQIGVIVSWGAGNEHYCGRVVQRFDKDLITLGAGSGNGWKNGMTFLTSSARVRVLPEGTVLKV